MHERALVADLFAKLEELARSSGGARVRRIRVWCGALSHLTEGSLRDQLAERARGTALEGVEVEVVRSSDLDDPRAEGVVLESVTLDDGDG